MEENHRLASWVPAFLEIDFVKVADLKPAGIISIDRRIQPCERVFNRIGHWNLLGLISLSPRFRV